MREPDRGSPNPGYLVPRQLDWILRFTEDFGANESPHRTPVSTRIPIDSQTTALLRDAVRFHALGSDTARRLFEQAAESARAVYERQGEVQMTSGERKSRGIHGEITVRAYLSAGRENEARAFAQRLVEDPLVPAFSKARVIRTIEFSS